MSTNKKISAGTGKRKHAPRISALASLSDLVREGRRVYRKTHAGEISTADLSRYMNALQILGGLIRTGDLEGRLEELEALMNNRGD